MGDWTELLKLCLNERMKRTRLTNDLGYNVYVRYKYVVW